MVAALARTAHGYPLVLTGVFCPENLQTSGIPTSSRRSNPLCAPWLSRVSAYSV